MRESSNPQRGSASENYKGLPKRGFVRKRTANLQSLLTFLYPKFNISFSADNENESTASTFVSFFCLACFCLCTNCLPSAHTPQGEIISLVGNDLLGGGDGHISTLVIKLSCLPLPTELSHEGRCSLQGWLYCEPIP